MLDIRNLESNVSEDELWLSYRDFAEAVLESARAWASTNEVPKSFEIEIYFKDAGYTERVIPVVRYMMALANLDEEIQQLSTYRKCIVRHVEAGAIQLLINKQSQAELGSEAWFREHWQLSRQILTPIFNALGETNSLDLPEELMRTRYFEYRHALSCSHYSYGVHVLLTNFSAEQSSTALGQFELKKIGCDEKTRIWNGREGGGVIPDLHTIREVTHQLFTQFNLPRVETHDPKIVLAEAEDITTAMRLRKQGEVGVFGMYITKCPGGNSDIGKYSCGQRSLFHSRLDTGYFRSQYTLESVDIPVINDLAAGLKKADYGLRIGIGRFNQAYERRSPEDKLIDLTIALESTLLSDVQDELKYRLGIRCAALLADERCAEATQFLARTIYNSRSKIVHEGQHLESQTLKITPSSARLAPAEFVQEAEALCRAVLRRYVLAAKAGIPTSKCTRNIEQQIVAKLGA